MSRLSDYKIDYTETYRKTEDEGSGQSGGEYEFTGEWSMGSAGVIAIKHAPTVGDLGKAVQTVGQNLIRFGRVAAASTPAGFAATMGVLAIEAAAIALIEYQENTAPVTIRL